MRTSVSTNKNDDAVNIYSIVYENVNIISPS